MAVWQRTAQQALNQATVYLPVALMALLALATYWLVHSTPSLGVAALPRAVTHIADYSLQDFSVSTYNPTGKLLHQLSGQSAHHFPDSNTLEMTSVKIKSFPTPSRVVRARADKALSNQDGSDVRLMGDAVIENENLNQAGRPVILQGETLEILNNQQRLQSDVPVRLQQGKNEFTGDSLRYDHLSGQAELHGRVRGTLQTTPTKKAP